MEITLIFITIFILFWVVFAFISEHRLQSLSFSKGKNSSKDSITKSFRKLQHCITYDTRSIKWRRSLISAFILTIVIFLLVWHRMPSGKEFLLHVLIILFGYNLMWIHYSSKIGTTVLKYCNENISHIKSLIKKNHTFIVPDYYK